MTINEMAAGLEQSEPSAELLAVVAADTRKGAQVLLKRYRRRQAEIARLNELYRYEDLYRQEGYELIAGTDEAGRGPLAGPVAAAAVILPSHFMLPYLNDSKKLSPSRREKLYEQILQSAIAHKIEMISAKEIDETNILLATQKAMYRAIAGLVPAPQAVLTDAVHLPRLRVPHRAIVRGDNVSAGVAAASILAKVSRDRLMLEYDRQYPCYGFAKHKGYGTPEHLRAIKKHDICPIHRRTFEPIRSLLEQQKCPPLPFR